MNDGTVIENWGHDHWSTFGYVESCICDNRGKLNNSHLRGHMVRRPAKYPTQLKDGEELHDHDDFDCIGDMLSLGLLDIVSNEGVVEAYASFGGEMGDLVEISVDNEHEFGFTVLGLELAAMLRTHKVSGGTWADFDAPGSIAFKSRLNKTTP